MRAQETLFSAIYPWECDINDALSIDRYFERFDEADRQFRLISNLTETTVGQRRVRIARIHNHLKPHDLVSLHSYIAFDGPFMMTVVHEMRHAQNDILCATVIDGFQPNTNAVTDVRKRFDAFQGRLDKISIPTLLDLAASHSKSSMDSLMSMGTRICFRGTVFPRDVGPEGTAGDQLVVHAFSQATEHLLLQEGVEANASKGDQFGGTPLQEMKLTWVSPLKAGDVFLVMSALHHQKTGPDLFRHHLFEARTKRTIAICESRKNESTRAPRDAESSEVEDLAFSLETVFPNGKPKRNALFDL